MPVTVVSSSCPKRPRVAGTNWGGARVRVLSVLPNLRMGGAQRIALDLAERLDVMGDVSIVCAAGSNGVLRGEVGDLAIHGFRSRLSLPTLPAFTLFLLRSIRRFRPHVILVHLLPLNLLVLALVALRIVRTPVVAVEHAHRTAAEESAKTSWLIRCLTRQLIRLLYPYASAVVGVSELVARDIASRMCNDANVRTIPNGIDVNRINRRAREHTRESMRLELLASPTLVAVGRLTPEKAFDDLLSAFAEVRLRPGFETASLAILGDGPRRSQLVEQANELGVSEAVWFPGFVANPWAVMARADIFVLSSRSEGFGLVVAEAVALGLPVVSTDCRSGPADILEGNLRARLVTVGDRSGMAEAICGLLRTAGSVQTVSIRECFTVDATARSYRKLFADILGQ